MNKSILISIRPEWVVKILNGEKTIEIRKTAPKCDLPIDVYIYCTKSGKTLYKDYFFELTGERAFLDDYDPFLENDEQVLNGKVVAKFTLREVTQYINGCNVSKDSGYMFGDVEREGVYEKSCLSENDIDVYCPDESFYAWHISDLVVFDEPKELSYFYKVGAFEEYRRLLADKELDMSETAAGIYVKSNYQITKAPQSWMYVEEMK